ncbi:MAG: NAD(P)H-quinone oxidoreductase subunit 4 [Xenococcaceae cyanobacterium MO_188.B32]|nr:NAD(P)H-quinone oxidoreductase subunit 4 [Xenococcaceae cyanobacterium MO_188.B32]
MNTIQFPWLTTLIALPLFASFLVPLIPDKDGKRLRLYALGVGIADFVLMCYAFWQNYDASTASLQMAESYTWIPQIGLNWAVSVDGISMPLVLLAGFVSSLSILSAWRVDRQPRLFYFLMLLLYAAQIGVFVAQDMLLLFIMWELELVPVYLLISIWGGKRRRYAAMKFILYTAAASIFILVAGLTMALYGGGTLTFDMVALAAKDYPIALEIPLYAGLLIAFGVKLAIFPLHTWLPDAHGEASSPISMILAGVLLKMGGYGLIRLNLGLLPDAHVYFAPILVVLGVVNIIYGAFASFGQTNMKRRLAYSSVSHMGFVLLGIASFTDLGISGAMLQMLSHGLIAAVLFFLAGVTYDRTHTMLLDKMGNLGQAMPKVFALFTAGAMASLALPGMSGFVSEIAVFVGFSNSDIYSSSFRTAMVFLSAVGLILTPIYLLSMLRQLFYGTESANACVVGSEGDREHNNEKAACFGNNCVLPNEAQFNDAQPREIFIAACFLVLIIGVGLYPKMATGMYDATTVAVNAQVRQSYTQIAQNNSNIYAQGLKLSQSEIASVEGIVK